MGRVVPARIDGRGEQDVGERAVTSPAGGATCQGGSGEGRGARDAACDLRSHAHLRQARAGSCH